MSNKFVLGVLHLGQTNFGVGGEIANNSYTRGEERKERKGAQVLREK